MVPLPAGLPCPDPGPLAGSAAGPPASMGGRQVGPPACWAALPLWVAGWSVIPSAGLLPTTFPAWQPDLSGPCAVGAPWPPASLEPQGPSGWLWGRRRRELEGPEPPAGPSPSPGRALTLDNCQHCVGPVQGDGEAQRSEVASFMQQVVEFLLSGGGTGRTGSLGHGPGAEGRACTQPRFARDLPDHLLLVLGLCLCLLRLCHILGSGQVRLGPGPPPPTSRSTTNPGPGLRTFQTMTQESLAPVSARSSSRLQCRPQILSS